MTKPLRIQFIIADGAHARWGRRSEDADDFVATRELKAHAHGGGGHTDRDHAAFAKVVADAINADAQTGHDDRLALIAPSHTLAAVQHGLTAQARDKVFRTLAKDLAKTPDHALGEWLRPLELE